MADRQASPRARVFLADDHAILRQGLRTILDQEGFEVVGEASDGQSAIRLCRTLQPEVAIFDLGMPLLNGIDATREVLRSNPRMKIIALTMYSESTYVLGSLRAGVSGYVLKNNVAMTLVQAIEAVLKGETYLSPGISRAVVEAYLTNVAPPVDPLSPREREVLQLIAEGKNMKEIGGLLVISSKTAESHRTNIMEKLKIHDIAGLVRYAIRHRLVTDGDDEGFTKVIVFPGSTDGDEGSAVA